MRAIACVSDQSLALGVGVYWSNVDSVREARVWMPAETCTALGLVKTQVSDNETRKMHPNGTILSLYLSLRYISAHQADS